MKTSNSSFSLYTRFLRETKGAAVIEFALTLPLLAIIFIGTVEISNLVYAQQKLQSAADNVVNIIGLQGDISNPDLLQDIAGILPNVVRPIEIRNSDYSVIVTVIQRDVGDDFAYVSMQPVFGGGPTGSGFSFNANATVNSENTASLADLSFTFDEGDQVIIVESYMRYRPLINTRFTRGLLGLQQGFIYHRTPPTQPRLRRFQFGGNSNV